jgi:hypothetical protein
MKAPMGRIANVKRIAIVTFEISVWNSAAMSFSTNISRKKSKASSDQPRKLAATTCFCSLVQPDNAEIVIEFASENHCLLSGGSLVRGAAKASELKVNFGLSRLAGTNLFATRHNSKRSDVSSTEGIWCDVPGFQT